MKEPSLDVGPGPQVGGVTEGRGPEHAGDPSTPRDPPEFPGQWLRGLLDTCLAARLAEGEGYGYELGAQLAAHGIGPVPGGSLYPALLRLENLGLCTSEWRAGDGGPGRKYYVLTDTGRAWIDARRDDWRRFSAAIDGVLAGERS